MNELTDFEKMILRRSQIAQEKRLPAAEPKKRRQASKPAAEEPKEEKKEEKREKIPFLSINTPDNQPLGTAFIHGETITLIIRNSAALSKIMLYPRNGADLSALPEEMNIKDPSADGWWRKAGMLKKNKKGNALYGHISRLPNLPWVPEKGHWKGSIKHGGYRLIAIAKAKQEES